MNSHVKGYGKIILACGVLGMRIDYPTMKYSVLEDTSAKSTHIKDNIYSKFGYRPIYPATRNSEHEDRVIVSSSEKQVLLSEFLKNAIRLFELDIHIPALPVTRS